MGNATSAASDVRRYREGYPGEEDDHNANRNVMFYSNKIPSRPDGDFIDTIHKEWFGNYDLLEIHHGYIQWLFPIREPGLNYHAQVLQLHEANKIKESKEMRERAIKSFEMMLDFYGMKLSDRKTGKIERAKNYRDRYRHLNRSFHNYLRITRILKFLGEIGLEKYKTQFLQHIIVEILVHRNLTNCRESCRRFWIEVIRNDSQRKKLYEFAKKLQAKPSLKNVNALISDDEEDETNESENNDSEEDFEKKRKKMESSSENDKEEHRIKEKDDLVDSDTETEKEEIDDARSEDTDNNRKEEWTYL